MTINKYFRGVSFALLAFIFFIGTAEAALTPNMILGSATAGTDAVQVTVYGADPNTSVQLFHPTASAYTSSNIGTTNSSGYLLTTVNSASLGITAQSPVYVMVNGKQSTTQNWPNYTTTGSLALSQNNLVIQVGQTGTVSAPAVTTALSVSSNSNSMVATVYINGNQITVNGVNSGTSNITICATGVGCSILAVTVQSPTVNSSTALSFSQNSISLAVGQSQPITISGPGNYYVSNNSNPGAVSTSLSGSALTVNAITVGTSILSICASGSNTTSCGIVNVTVTGANSTSNTTNSDNMITFSPTSANLAIGEKQTVGILGSGNYFVTSNSNSTAVTAIINGSKVDLIGVAFGGANIKICQILGGCGNLYVYVAPSNTNTGTVAPTTSGTPSISSVTVASNNTNGFLGSGSVLTVTFSTNQVVNIPTVTIAGNKIPALGSGSGPYTATYSISGKESTPMSLVIAFNNTSGLGGQINLSLGALSMTASPSSGSASASATFTQYLQVGSIGPEVTALQNTLIKLGVYSGPITGKFGAQTEAAVKKYQAKHNLTQIGVVGPATRSLLNQGI